MAMANAGFDGTVTEADYAYMWAVGGQEGVESAAAWKVTQGTGRQVSCAAQSGRAFARGVVSKDSAANLVSLTTPTNGGWFLIVRHLDWTANTVTVVALTGLQTTTLAPTVPPVDYSGVTGMATTPGATYDQPLAWAWVRSSDTTMVLFDLRRVPGSAADLTELATLGGPEGDTKAVREGGALFERAGGVWLQSTPSRFATVSARDTAYAKASGAYKVQGAHAITALDSGFEWVYYDAYNSSSNPSGAQIAGVPTAGWYPSQGTNPPRCVLSISGSTIASGSVTVLGGSNAWTEVEDVFGWHNPASNPSRIMPNVPGRYRIENRMSWAANSAGTRLIVFRKNGTNIDGAQATVSAAVDSSGQFPFVITVDLNGSDYLEAVVLQASGSSLALTDVLSVTYVGIPRY